MKMGWSQEEIRAALRSLGLKKSEIEIYVTLWRAGEPLGARKIAERTGLSEKTVRKALKIMLEKGYVKGKRKGRGMVYSAVSARTIVERWKKSIEKRIGDIFSRLQFPWA